MDGGIPSKRHKPSPLLLIYSELHSIFSTSIPILQQLAGITTPTNILKKDGGGECTEEAMVNCLASSIQQLSNDLQEIVKSFKCYPTKLKANKPKTVDRKKVHFFTFSFLY